MAAPMINGVTFHPSKEALEETRNGTVHVAANGARTWLQREGSMTAGATVTYTWEKIDLSTANSIYTAAITPSTSFALTLASGSTITVQAEEDSWQQETSVIVSNTAERYDVTLKLYKVS